jgi:hypothetical protein
MTRRRSCCSACPRSHRALGSPGALSRRLGVARRGGVLWQQRPCAGAISGGQACPTSAGSDGGIARLPAHTGQSVRARPENRQRIPSAGAGPEFGGGGRSVTGRSWSVMSRSATHDATPTPEVSCDSGRGLPSGSSSRGGIYCSTARLVVRKLEMAGTAIDFAVRDDRRTCPHGWLSLLNGCSSGLWGRPTVTHRPGHVPAGGDHTRRCRRAGRDATRVRWCRQPGRCQEQGRGGRRRWRRGK